MAPLLFNVFNNDVDKEIECALSRFEADPKLRGAVDTCEGWDAIQRVLDKLEKWNHVDIRRSNEANYKVYLGHGNLNINTGWEMKGLRAALPRRTWGWMKSWI